MSHRSRAVVRRVVGIFSVLTLRLLLGVAPAHGQETAAGTRAHLRFVGVPGCDDRTMLEREAERRLDGLQWTSESTAASVDVRISSEGSRFEGLVAVRRLGSPQVTRAITTSTCQEVIEGAALIVAVILSPNNSAQLAPSPERPTVPAPPSKTSAASWSFGAGTSVNTWFGIAPAALPGFEVLADGSTYGNGWAPSIRVSFRHAARSGFAIGTSEAQASFRLDAGVLVACPVAWSVMPSLLARGCVSGAYGKLSAAGSGADEARSDDHPWVEVGAGLRLELRPLKQLSVELEAGAEVPLATSRFWFGGETFYESSPVAGRVGLAVVARIPE